jgi:hypothetical protein
MCSWLGLLVSLIDTLNEIFVFDRYLKILHQQELNMKPLTQKCVLAWMFVMLIASATGHVLFPLNPSAVENLHAMVGMGAGHVSHQFADLRHWMGIPNAMDVLSNLGFALMGLCGGWALMRPGAAPLAAGHRCACALVFFGLVLTSLGSSWYHLWPDDARLFWDRLGMLVVFAGMLGLIAAEKIKPQSGLLVSVLSLAAGVLALFVWQSTSDVLPWAVFQFGGLGLLVLLATRQAHEQALRVKFLGVVLAYALAKLFEIGDHAIWHLTDQTLSGHTLKHLVASLAAVPVIVALRAEKSVLE